MCGYVCTDIENTVLLASLLFRLDQPNRTRNVSPLFDLSNHCSFVFLPIYDSKSETRVADRSTPHLIPVAQNNEK